MALPTGISLADPAPLYVLLTDSSVLTLLLLTVELTALLLRLPSWVLLFSDITSVEKNINATAVICRIHHLADESVSSILALASAIFSCITSSLSLSSTGTSA